MARSSWTDGELDLLAQMRRDGKDPRDIAPVLSKTVPAVRSKLFRMDALARPTASAPRRLDGGFHDR